MRFDIVPVTNRGVLVGSSQIERVLIAVHIENMGSFGVDFFRFGEARDVKVGDELLHFVRRIGF